MKDELILIESRTNPVIKECRAMSMAKTRKDIGLHRIEGDRLVREAILSGAALRLLLVEDGFEIDPPAGCAGYRVNRSVMESVTETETPQHLCALVKTPDTALPAQFPAGLIVLLDGVQDPGNVGAILRSADAFGAQGVLLSPACADPFSPKSLRAAMGSTYHLPIWRGETASALKEMKRQGFTAVCGHLHGSETMPALHQKTALVIGNEGAGVGEETAAECCLFRLPMKGRAESLNAAVAAGILIYLTQSASQCE